ncbi:protein tyrosine kinase [Ancylostoma duodenale]|uniref:Protein tyrosine kinase n=1 Tax=Ancylostoma duodenale TaxID=51022 RepID=A0A0C2GV92_9BILA|nr:protein tyrosine kinase [Ancylostoma duodenale]
MFFRFENNKWVLGAHKKKGAPRFDTVVDLIEYYKKHELPGHIVMKTPIPRPKWLIKHDMCKFDMLKDLIGTGNFCKVFRGTYERDKNDVVPVAIKICHGASIQTVTEEAKQARESMIHEAQLMSYYVHKHVIQLYGVACDHYPVMIVMEYCPGGNLQEHMQKYKQKVSMNERILLSYEAAKGMRYLHSKGCVHRDLAARNCLISDGGIKISDFGLSKIAEELEAKKDEKADPPIEHIPLRWMAPETLKRPQLWSTKSDVWSFGVVSYTVY